MKRSIPAFLLAFIVLMGSFTPFYSIEEVVAAMRNGNATQLARFFDNRVDISLPGKSDNYSRNQAELIIRDFFSQHSVENFQVKHKGNNSDGSQFCIGDLITREGDFRTKFFMKQKGDKQVIQEMEFQSDF